MNDHESPAPAARPKNRAEKTEDLREVLEHLRARQQARANGDRPPSPGLRRKTTAVFFARPGRAGNEKEPANSWSESAGSDINCHVCGDKRMVTRNVPLDHPDFGRAFVCPACQGGPDLKRRQTANLAAYFRDHWLWNSAKLGQHTLDDFYFLDEDLAVGKGWSITAAQLWARGDLLTYDQLGMVEPTVAPFEPSPALVISGPSGLGKTCLASAAFVARVGQEGVGLPIEYNALMRAVLQQMDRPDGQPDAAVMIAARVPLLFIDDLGNTFLQGRETPGRQRWLFEIINHRYNERLPLIVTTNLTFEDLADQFDEKLAQRLLEYAVWIEMGGPSLRLKNR